MMLVALTLQIVGAASLVAGVFLLFGVGAAFLAGAVPLFAAGWLLEQKKAR